MEILVLTSKRKGLASLAILQLQDHPNIQIKQVIFCDNTLKPTFNRRYRRIIKKVLNIGLLGALNGIRMRKWYVINDLFEILDIETVCNQLKIPFATVPKMKDDSTIQYFKDSKANIGISLSNGYIPSSIFSIPKLGMINIHHEILPEYQGAQSIIWQLYNKSKETGYTIHQIDKGIDTGRILYQQKFPIQFKNTLAETVKHNYLNSNLLSINGLVELLNNYDYFINHSKDQKFGKKYTTPSIVQFLKMYFNFLKLKHKELQN